MEPTKDSGDPKNKQSNKRRPNRNTSTKTTNKRNVRESSGKIRKRGNMDRQTTHPRNNKGDRKTNNGKRRGRSKGNSKNNKNTNRRPSKTDNGEGIWDHRDKSYKQTENRRAYRENTQGERNSNHRTNPARNNGKNRNNKRNPRTESIQINEKRTLLRKTTLKTNTRRNLEKTERRTMANKTTNSRDGNTPRRHRMATTKHS